MKFINTKAEYESKSYLFQKPNICPHCGITIDAKTEIMFVSRLTNLVIYTCTYLHCKKKFYATYFLSTTVNGVGNLELQYMYPQPQIPDIPQRLVDLSECFARRCREAYYSELAGHLELAACGYRNAIEALVKDYAVTYCECNLSEHELLKLSIDKCIREYLSDLDTVTSAYFAKEEGNKATHYPVIAGEEFSFTEFMVYFRLFVSAIDGRVQIHQLSENLPLRHKQKFEPPAPQNVELSEDNQ